MVRAKFVVGSVQEYEFPKGSKNIVLRVVQASTSSKNPETGQWESKITCEENRIFGDATPSGSISMLIHNPAAGDQFAVGKSYYVDFSPAPE